MRLAAGDLRQLWHHLDQCPACRIAAGEPDPGDGPRWRSGGRGEDADA